jgi:tetratricopeptide (TPR) repeat protein
MAEKKVTTTKTTESTDAVINRARGFWAEYSKPIIYIGSAIILLIGGWYGYKYFIQAPKEEKANQAIFPAEALFDKMAAGGFNKDSSVIVLNGGNNDGVAVTGLLKVINNFDGTKAANRAEYMAGATYLHLKEFDKAIKYLKAFDADGAHQVKSKAYIMLGHAYAEQNKTAEALDYYKKAAAVNTKDEGTTADALFVAASYADATGNQKEAVTLYQQLKNDYPNATAVKSGDIDKYLARLGILK